MNQFDDFASLKSARNTALILYHLVSTDSPMNKKEKRKMPLSSSGRKNKRAMKMIVRAYRMRDR